MNFRLRVAVWFALSMLILAGVLVFTAHLHLDEELRKGRWDRSHPQFPQWTIHSSYTDEEVQDILGELIQVWCWVGIPLVLASLAAGYFIALRSVRPIRKINRELAALNPRSLALGVSLPERDKELVTLVKNINDLLRRVDHSYQEMADFSARVAHELRTPLTLLRMRMEATASQLPPDLSEEVQEEIRRLSQLVERSLLAAKAEGGKLDVQLTSVNISDLMEDLSDGYALLADEHSITLDWRKRPGITAVTDPQLLRQILHNLIGNAIRHGEQKARVDVFHSHASNRIVFRISNYTRSTESRQLGIGMRLVRSLASALNTHLKVREGGRIYSVRMTLNALYSGC